MKATLKGMLYIFIIVEVVSFSINIFAEENHFLRKSSNGYAFYDSSGEYKSGIENDLIVKEWNNIIIIYGNPEGLGLLDIYDLKTGKILTSLKLFGYVCPIFSDNKDYFMVIDKDDISSRSGIILIGEDGNKIWDYYKITSIYGWGMSPDGEHIAIVDDEGGGGYKEYTKQMNENKNIKWEDFFKNELLVFDKKGNLLNKLSLMNNNVFLYNPPELKVHQYYKGKPYIKLLNSGKLAIVADNTVINLRLNKVICFGYPIDISQDEKYATCLSQNSHLYNKNLFSGHGEIKSNDLNQTSKIVDIKQDELSNIIKKSKITKNEDLKRLFMYIDIYSVETGELVGRSRLGKSYFSPDLKEVPVRSIKFNAENNIEVKTNENNGKIKYLVNLEEAKKLKGEEDLRIFQILKEINTSNVINKNELISYLKTEITHLKNTAENSPEKSTILDKINSLDIRINDAMSYEETIQISRQLSDLKLKYKLIPTSGKKKLNNKEIEEMHKSKGEIK